MPKGDRAASTTRRIRQREFQRPMPQRALATCEAASAVSMLRRSPDAGLARAPHQPVEVPSPTHRQFPKARRDASAAPPRGVGAAPVRQASAKRREARGAGAGSRPERAVVLLAWSCTVLALHVCQPCSYVSAATEGNFRGFRRRKHLVHTATHSMRRHNPAKPHRRPAPKSPFVDTSEARTPSVHLNVRRGVPPAQAHPRPPPALRALVQPPQVVPEASGNRPWACPLGGTCRREELATKIPAMNQHNARNIQASRDDCSS